MKINATTHTVPPWFYRQAGAIPVRFRDEHWELLLITSRNKQRWIIPKGVIEPGADALETASKEAFEEAGVEGFLSPEPVGRYQVDKWGGTCEVEVYLLETSAMLDTWPEQAVRQRRWMTIDTALAEVHSEALRRLLSLVPDYLDEWRRRIPLTRSEENH